MLVEKTLGLQAAPIEFEAFELERDRRREGRHVALLRVGVLHARGDRNLCVVKNISASGLSARAYQKVAVGDEVHIEFKSGGLLSGRVVWARDWNIGIKFPDLIDVQAVLSSRWVVEAQRRRNLPRIPLVCGGRLKSGGRSIGGHLLDISQAGARLRVDVSQVELGEAGLSLPGLESISGLIRWITTDQAGLSFNECLSFEKLASWIHAQRN
jgi:hypothetical protein